MKRWLCKLKAFLFGKRNRHVHFIQGNDVLPHPLARDEEEAALIALENGDQQARDTLIEHNLRLVVYIAKRYETNPIFMEDLISIGTIGLIKAVNTFKRDKNIKLVTYASRCIENEILMFLRKKSRRKTEISFDEPLNVDYDGNELLLSDILGTEGDIVAESFYAEEDKRQKEEVEVRNQTDSLCYSTEQTIADLGDKVSADVKGEAEAAISEAKKALEGTDVDAIKAAGDKLQEVAYKLAQIVYADAQQETGGSAAASSDDDVVDADYEVVDDDQDK